MPIVIPDEVVRATGMSDAEDYEPGRWRDLSNAMALDAATLLRHIEESFGRMTYPGDECIVADNSGWDLDFELPKRALMGRHWRDVSFDILDELRSSPSFLSAEGFRFYLPAFMVLSIRDHPRTDVLPAAVVSLLTLPYLSDVDEIRERWCQVTLPQITTEEKERYLSAVEEDYRSGLMERLFFERVSGFHRAQSNIIREFLKFLQEVHTEAYQDRTPEIAIERYWSRFAEGNEMRGKEGGTGRS